MNPYIDEDLATLAEHARRFASGRVAPGFLERDDTRVLDRTPKASGSSGAMKPSCQKPSAARGWAVWRPA